MNTFGRKFRVTVFGESHQEAVGVVLDGVPAGLEISTQDFSEDILRRKSGAKGTTPRVESDEPQILSGVFEGYTTGAPLAIIFRNENVRSQDYSDFAGQPRPGHADLTAAIKYDDCQDPRGGGHFSGRLTLPVVAAGVVAKKIISDATILDETPVSHDSISAGILSLGGITLPEVHLSGPLPEPWEEAIDAAIAEGDSLGAVIQCKVNCIDPGYGEPFWDSVESMISHAVFSIPGVRGIEFGDGFRASAMKGSEHNDPIGEDGRPVKNGAGGISGGITNGAQILFNVAIKPTSSISKEQMTYNFETSQLESLCVKGRHDACFALRCPVIVEAMCAIALADLILLR